MYSFKYFMQQSSGYQHSYTATFVTYTYYSVFCIPTGCHFDENKKRSVLYRSLNWTYTSGIIKFIGPADYLNTASFKSIYIPIINTNQPKAGFSFAPSILEERKLPTSNPAIAMLEMINKKCQSIGWL